MKKKAMKFLGLGKQPDIKKVREDLLEGLGKIYVGFNGIRVGMEQAMIECEKAQAKIKKYDFDNGKKHLTDMKKVLENTKQYEKLIQEAVKQLQQ